MVAVQSKPISNYVRFRGRKLLNFNDWSSLPILDVSRHNKFLTRKKGILSALLRMVPHLVYRQVVFLQLAQVSVQAVDASPHVKQVGCPEIIILKTNFQDF